jgi:polysaccharide biosynthesis protein PslG
MPKRRIRWAVGIIVVTLLLCCAAPAASSNLQGSPAQAPDTARLNERFGAVSSHLILADPRTMERQLDAAAEAGIKWVRCGFAWTDLERKKGVWDFSRTDLLIQKASARGIKILALLGACPTWANGGHHYFYPPTDMAAWRNYVATVCGRYRGRIPAWEIWNEENIADFWKPKADPKRYVQLLGCASAEIRKADPEARVIFGGVAGLGKKYLNDCLAAGAANYVDAIAYHPYSSDIWGFFNPLETRPNEDVCRRVLQDMRSMISRYTSRRLEIWLTELGWNTCGWWGTVDEKTQAAYMLRTLVNYASQGVDKVFYYSLYDEFPWIWWPDHYGLVKNNFTPKLAFYYYQALEKILGEATPAGAAVVLSASCAKPSSLEVHPFRLPDGSLIVVSWKRDNLSDSLDLTVAGSGLNAPVSVGPSAVQADGITDFIRDGNGNITVRDVAVGKVPVIVEFQSPAGDATSTP